MMVCLQSNLVLFFNHKLKFVFDLDYVRMGSTGEQESSDSLESSDTHNHDLEHDNHHRDRLEQASQLVEEDKTNLNRLLKSNNADNSKSSYGEQGDSSNQFNRNGLGELVVFDTTLLEEFAVKQQQDDNNKQSICDNHNITKDVGMVVTTTTNVPQQMSPKVNVSIQDWKSSNHHHTKQPQQHHETTQPGNDANQNNSADVHQQLQQQNSSFEVEEEEDEALDEEMERLRLDQERSFKAKLYAFESLAKQDEEQARKASEASRRRQQQRAEFSTKQQQQQLRSKSCSNMLPVVENTTVAFETKKKVAASASAAPSHSIGGSLQNSLDEAGSAKQQAVVASRTPNVAINRSTQPPKSQSRSMQNLSMQPTTSQTVVAIGVPASSTSIMSSTVYNFQYPQQPQPQPLSSNKSGQVGSKSVCQLPELLTMPDNAETLSQQSSQSEPTQQLPMKTRQQLPMDRTIDHLNIYENVPPPAGELRSSANHDGQLLPHDPSTIRNASHKLLAQQQQIYQNQPLPLLESNDKAMAMEIKSAMSSVRVGGNGFNVHQPQQQQQNHHQDDVGLPPMHTNQMMMPTPILMKQGDEHLYVNHNQLMINPTSREAAQPPPAVYEYGSNNYDG